MPPEGPLGNLFRKPIDKDSGIRYNKLVPVSKTEELFGEVA